MYEAHFGFHRQPFQVCDGKNGYFQSESAIQIIPQLLHALRTDLGVAVLTGPIGCGKTTLLRHLGAMLSGSGRAVLCSAAGLESQADLLDSLLHAALQTAGQTDLQSLRTENLTGAIESATRWNVRQRLQKSTDLWGPVILLVDDAHLLSVHVLNEIRAFSEELTDGRQLVRCLIAGPLTLEDELARPSHADFSGRIRCHAFLQPLTMRESVAYLGKQLQAVGGDAAKLITNDALNYIVAAADGSPRAINLLTDESLIVAAASGVTKVDLSCVETAFRRLQHLPYAWAVSRTDAQNGVDHDFVSEDESIVTETQKIITSARKVESSTQDKPSVYEYSGPGVIEIGAAAPNQSVAGTANLQSARSNEAAVQISAMDKVILDSAESSAGNASVEIAFSDDAEPVSSNDVAAHHFLSGAVAAEDVSGDNDSGFGPAFEEMDQSEVNEGAGTSFYECSATDTSTSRTHNPMENEDASPADASTVADTIEIDWISATGPFSRKLLVEDTSFVLLDVDTFGADHGPECRAREPESALSCSSDVSDSEFDSASESVNAVSAGDCIDEAETPDRSGTLLKGLSNRLPVFDRYTWVQLGRDVPYGYANRTAERVYEIPAQEPQSFRALTPPVGMDQIEMKLCSDAEISASLSVYSSPSVCGSFFFGTPTVQSDVPANRWRQDDSEVDLQNEVASSDEKAEIVTAEAETCEEDQRHNQGDDSDDALLSRTEAAAFVSPLKRWRDGQLLGASQLPENSEQRDPEPSSFEEEPQTIPIGSILDEKSTPGVRGEIRESGVTPETSERPADEDHSLRFFTLPVPVETADSHAFRNVADNETGSIVDSVVDFQADMARFQKPAPGLTKFSSDDECTTDQSSERLAGESRTGTVYRPGMLLQQALERIVEQSSVENATCDLSEPAKKAITESDASHSLPDDLVAVAKEIEAAGEKSSGRFSNLFTRLRQMKESNRRSG